MRNKKIKSEVVVVYGKKNYKKRGFKKRKRPLGKKARNIKNFKKGKRTKKLNYPVIDRGGFRL